MLYVTPIQPAPARPTVTAAMLKPVMPQYRAASRPDDLRLLQRELSFAGSDSRQGQTRLGWLHRTLDRWLGADPYRLGRQVRREVARIEAEKPQLIKYAAIPLAEWVAQFQTRDERLLALKLFENIRFFDVEDIRQGAHHLHRWLAKQPGYDPERTKFTHVAVGKSGGLIHYFYRQVNNLPNQSGIEFSRIGEPIRIHPEKDIDTLVILDDFLGTGREVEWFLGRMEEALKRYRRIYFLTMVGYQEGIDMLARRFPQVTVHVLEKHRKIMDPENDRFTPREKERIARLVARYSQGIHPVIADKPEVFTPFGYRDGQALVGFFFNTPSNTLPVFWGIGNGWKPIFPRFDSYNVPYQDATTI